MKIDLTSAKRKLSSEIRGLVYLLAVLLAAPGMLGNPARAQADSPLEMTVSQLRALPPETTVVLDTRPIWSFLLGHVPGAQITGTWETYTVHRNGVPGLINRDRSFWAEKLRSLGIDYSKTIVIYGDPESKWREDGRFFWMMEFLGFPRVALLRGGYEAWKEAGFEIERGRADSPPPVSLRPEDIRFNESTVADQQWILKRLGSPDLVVVDNRERSEYDGATPYGSPRGGHIPGALHLDWREFFDSQGRLKPRNQLESLIRNQGIRPGQEIVVYCTGGVRSAMAYFVFRVLGYQVRNYDGSWWDWSHNPSLPIESS